MTTLCCNLKKLEIQDEGGQGLEVSGACTGQGELGPGGRQLSNPTQNADLLHQARRPSVNRGALLGCFPMWEEALDSDSGNHQPQGAEISKRNSTLLRSPAVDVQALTPQAPAVTKGETLTREETGLSTHSKMESSSPQPRGRLSHLHFPRQ